MNTSIQRALLALAASLTLPGPALGQPIVRDATTTIYAVVTDPIRLAFAPDGTLFTGRDASGSGGGSGDAVKIHRIAPGGAPVTDYGSEAILDPDALIVDVAGVVSGTPGAVLVGGVNSNPLGQGQMSKVAPDGAVTILFGPSASLWNPTHFIFDSTGRLLFTEYNNGKVMVTTGATPTVLCSVASATFIAEDATGRLVVSSSADTWLRLFSTNGTLLNGSFAQAKTGSPLARGPGGVWGTDLYAVAANGDLIRVDLLGAATNHVGTGFDSVSDLQFGPDAKLYASEFSSDRVYRFARPAVPGCATTIYARVTDPVMLSFAPDGTLFVGRDNAGSGGNNWDAVKIHRIAPGGSSVTEYGNSPITDPDAVFYDAAGTISGTPGTVIVGGVDNAANTQGKLVKILPDQAVVSLFGPTTFMINPSDFVSDSTGRLLFTDYESGLLWVMTNATPTVLASGVPLPVPMAVDAQDRILVNATSESRVRLYSPGGALLTNSLVLAETRTPLALGPAGFWGTGVYYVNTNGDLMTVDLGGNSTKVGTSFASLNDCAFGPDGALYASHFDSDLIWRIAPEAPLLRLWSTATNTVIVAWPWPATGWLLHATTNLAAAGSGWTELPPPYQTNVADLQFIEPSPVHNKFYRLHKP